MAKGRSNAAGGRGGDEIAAPEEAVVGFAKLQGDDFEYYMQTYSIVLGRNSKTSEVDVDLASIGGGMSISRRHARIFYDFPRRRFVLEVLGKNGCFVEGVLHAPGAPPVELDSRDLLQMGEKRFYFLLPSRSVFAAGPVPRCQPPAALAPSAGRARPRDYGNEVHGGDAEEAGEDEARRAVVGSSGKRRRRDLGEENVEEFGRAEEAAPLRHSVKKPETRSRADREADNQQLLQLEEKDLFEIYGDVWHHSRVRRYLTSEDCPESETEGRPWFGLLMLLRKHPEHFAINIQSKGRAKSEFVSLHC
ncbi:hypothetical protein C4D60_Mb06t21190 [Musa balbisiana]|uniref:FHA domain-containing protein n=1 Tax=Musa balbisiana TaxID=52838 RepID=A0A4S8IQB5_MUSBA|nr:hypothetical protein C4D60_Mb06t21190 [Musa balbisiana]